MVFKIAVDKNLGTVYPYTVCQSSAKFIWREEQKY
jgi:hypothetical protein